MLDSNEKHVFIEETLENRLKILFFRKKSEKLEKSGQFTPIYTAVERYTVNGLSGIDR